jgi:hypothetical protein
MINIYYSFKYEYIKIESDKAEEKPDSSICELDQSLIPNLEKREEKSAISEHEFQLDGEEFSGLQIMCESSKNIYVFRLTTSTKNNNI